MSQFSVKGFFFIYLLIQVLIVKTEVKVIFVIGMVTGNADVAKEAVNVGILIFVHYMDQKDSYTGVEFYCFALMKVDYYNIYQRFIIIMMCKMFIKSFAISYYIFLNYKKK